MPETLVTVTDAQQQQFQEEGWFLLERAIPADPLRHLQDECQRFIDAKDAEMDAKGVDVLGINHRKNRYFLPFTYRESEANRAFIFSDLMADICRATLGENAWLFLDQYVVKAAEKGLKFSWHQDSGYIGYPHRPYLTCWCALDDVTEENGTVYLLPYSRAGTREMVPHVKDEELNDKVGYFGDDPGIPVIAPAGSIACFSSTLFHRSGPNTTDRMRRAFLVQYSVEPILSADRTRVLHVAEPFLVDGRKVV